MGPAVVEVEQAIIDAGERVTNKLRKYLRVMNGVSTISPLLGLLGTVLGMINVQHHRPLQRDGAVRNVAGGIGEALLTKAGGFFVAIPAMIAYLYFVGRVDRLIMEIDGLGQQNRRCHRGRRTTACGVTKPSGRRVRRKAGERRRRVAAWLSPFGNLS